MEITRDSLLEYRKRYFRILDTFSSINPKFKEQLQPPVVVPSDSGRSRKLIELEDGFFKKQRGRFYVSGCYVVYKNTIFYNDNFIATFFNDRKEFLLFEYKDKNTIEEQKPNAIFIYNNQLIEDMLYCYNLKKIFVDNIDHGSYYYDFLLLETLEFNKTIELVLNEENASSIVFKIVDLKNNEINYAVKKRKDVFVYNKDNLLRLYGSYNGLFINVIENVNLKRLIVEQEV